jgi:hydroxymethylpyrimidine pyrophosphatase-like HAD family hydrolase
MANVEKKKMAIDYKNLTPEMLRLLEEQYPAGFNGHYIKFPNSKGEIISAVRLETDEIIYLVKVSAQQRQIFTEAEMDEMVKGNDKEGDDEVAEDSEEEEDNSRKDRDSDDD